MMSASAGDPYAVLGLTPEVSDGELHRVYRALVKRHHPDHNGGSPESAARFALIQDAYARVTLARRATRPAAAAQDPSIERRIADIERELAGARAAQRSARPAEPIGGAAPSAANGQAGRPTPHELGYYETDDSITRIIDDATAGLADRLKDARDSELSRRLTDLFGGTHDEP
jgi:curved DNA-binding protein CbpA